MESRTESIAVAIAQHRAGDTRRYDLDLDLEPDRIPEVADDIGKAGSAGTAEGVLDPRLGPRRARWRGTLAGERFLLEPPASSGVSSVMRDLSE